MQNSKPKKDKKTLRINISAATQQFLDQSHQLLIDGIWVDGEANQTIETCDPARNHVLASVAVAGPKDVNQAVIAARKALKGPWSKLTHFERARLLNRLAKLIELNTDLLTEIEVLDAGMSTNIARLTVSNMVEMLEYYAGAAQRIEGKTTTSPRHLTDLSEALTYTIQEPVGVAALIIPWNAPAISAMLKLAPALAAGCTVILKPSEQAPLSSLLIGQLCLEAGIPAGVVNVVNGLGKAAGVALSTHSDVDKVSFTGSTETGRKIILAATGNLKKVSLELGGKSPVVVMPDVNLNEVVPEVISAGFFMQGQNSMAGTRFFVHESIHDEFIEKAKFYAEQLVIGHGIDPATVIGPMISEQHCQKVLNYIETGIEEGATLLTGGKQLAGPGLYIQPTIFTDCTPEMTIVREEIFGPVITIQKFSTNNIDKIAELANNTNYGLSGSVWTKDLAVGHAVVARIRAGQVSINCHGAIGTNIPFGGYGESGWGREYGQEGLNAYLETKAITAKL